MPPTACAPPVSPVQLLPPMPPRPACPPPPPPELWQTPPPPPVDTLPRPPMPLARPVEENCAGTRPSPFCAKPVVGVPSSARQPLRAAWLNSRPPRNPAAFAAMLPALLTAPVAKKATTPPLLPFHTWPGIRLPAADTVTVVYSGTRMTCACPAT